MKEIGLLFPGQGSQYIGMGKDLFNKYDFIKDIFNEASEILQYDLADLIFNGDEEKLKDTRYAQPAIFVVSYAAYKVFLHEIGIQPKISAGHSLGEISALVCAGAIDFHNAVKIVKIRGELMAEASKYSTGAMAAISGVSIRKIEEICFGLSTIDSVVAIANFNARNQIVISGEKELVGLACEKLKDLGGKATLLNVSAAFHSNFMKPASEKFKAKLLQYEFKPLKYAVISNTTAENYRSHLDIPDILAKQIYSPVRWMETVWKIRKDCYQVIEIAPKNVLKNLIVKDNIDLDVYLFDKEKDIKATIQGIFPNAKYCSKNNFIERIQAIVVCTQNCNFNNDEYQDGVINNYKTLVEMKEKIESSGKEISLEEMKKALDLLKAIFEAKKTEIRVQKERFNQLITETDLKDVLKEYIEIKFS